jgi:SAM-dependent methyltransferase
MSTSTGARQRDVGGFFDEEADRYDAAYDGDDWAGRFLRARMSAALEALGAGPGRVLDVGMGGGRMVAELTRRGWTASGVDSSARMVEIAARRLPELRDRLSQADLAALPFGEGDFDAVVATGVVEYAEDLDRALGELARVLRAGGRAAISWPNYRSPYAIWRGWIRYPLTRGVKRVLPLPRPAPIKPLHRLPVPRFADALAAAGFEVLGSRPISPRIGGASGLGRLLAPQLLFRAQR